MKTENFEQEENEEKSIFVEYFGASPMIKVLDFLIEARDFDYSMTEIARNSAVGWSAFSVVFKRLLEKNIIKQTRTIGNAKLYKLNTENSAVQKLINLDEDLTKIETEKITKISKSTKKVVV